MIVRPLSVTTAAAAVLLLATIELTIGAISQEQDTSEISLTTSIYVTSQRQNSPSKDNNNKQAKSELVDFDDWPQSYEQRAESEIIKDPDDRFEAANALQQEEASMNGTSLLPPVPVSASSGQQTNLNGGFLVLFDEITRMKNNSINALIRLQYFDDNSLNKINYSNSGNGGDSSQANLSAPTRLQMPPNRKVVVAEPAPSVGQQQQQKLSDSNIVRPTIRTTARNNRFKLRLPPSVSTTTTTNKVLQADMDLAGKVNKWQLSSWFESLGKKVNSLFRNLASGLSASLGSNSARQQPYRQSTRVTGGPGGGGVPSAGSSATSRQRERTFDGREHELTKRHTTFRDDPQQSTTVFDNGVGGGLADKSNLRVINFDGPRLDDDRSGGGKSACVELNEQQLAVCRSTELLVSYNLNNSFPGTLQAIEDNCRHISSLLSNCWPQQLAYLRSSLASWNETVLSMTDFPLPAPQWSPAAAAESSSSGDIQAPAAVAPSGGGGGARAGWPTCGVASQLVTDLVMDRINWMWLNLCMDRKFRLDYVENLKCLSLWTQERAQSVCSNEYKRMQLNLRSPSSHYNYSERRTNQQQQQQHQQMQQQRKMMATTLVLAGDNTKNGGQEALRRQPRGIDFVPSINIAAISAAPAPANQPLAVGAAVRPSFDGLDEREIESKILCCIFDLFLRCVNRQAVRDCGRHGGQFVVNFMSRIGTDDMKYLCNSEPRSVAQAPDNTNLHPTNLQQYQQQQQLPANARMNLRVGPKRNNNQADRSPFIQSNYCTDTRIVSVLYGKSTEVYGDRAGSSQTSANGNTRSNVANGDHFGNRHTPANFGPDQNFYEGASTVDSSALRLGIAFSNKLWLITAATCFVLMRHRLTSRDPRNHINNIP